MKRNWNSVVGKLWATILLLVFLVLFVLSVLMMQFFNSFFVNWATDSLTNNAEKIAGILEKHDEDLDFAINVAWETLEDVTNAIIVVADEDIYYSDKQDAERFSLTYFQNDQQLKKVLTKQETVTKEIHLKVPGKKHDQILMVGVPLEFIPDRDGAVYVYQSLDVMNDMKQVTAEIILWSALIAFILTTVFAFFLSTRITAPLRKMRESAAEVAKGKFDVQVPILTHDEIGELAVTFNQMRRKLKVNMTELKQEKEQLSSILSSMADGVITFNRKGEIVVTNPPAEDFLEHCRKTMEENQDSEIPQKLKELIIESISEGTEQTGELEIHGKYWTVIVTPQFDEQSIRGAVAVFRDMTEERKLDKIRKDFIANVSHELRTPIAMLQGYSEALMDDIASTEQERKEISTVIYEESLRMGRLVNELLDLARLESGNMGIHKELVVVKPFIERIGNKFSVMAKDHQINLEVKVETEEEKYLFDPDRIEQVLTNLVDNAIRHTRDGGFVKIHVYSTSEGLQMEVSDNGSGIPEEDLPFIFERFYKADKARTRGSSGTGLGLAIAKNIIEAHEGTIRVESELRRGTTFIIFLPGK